MMDQFDAKYGLHLNSLDTTAEIEHYSFSDAEVDLLDSFLLLELLVEEYPD